MIEQIKEWSSFILWLLGGFTGWIWWSMKTRFTTKEDHEELRGATDKLEARVGSMETAVRNLPTINDLHEIAMRQAINNQEMKAQNQTLIRIQRQIDRIEEFLMNEAKK